MAHYEVRETLNMVTGKKRWYINGKRTTAQKVEFLQIMADRIDTFRGWEHKGISYNTYRITTKYPVGGK